MSDPRAVRNTDGMVGDWMTFIHSGIAAASEGSAVSMSGNNGVKLCGSNDPIIGRLVRVEDAAACTVQVRGVIEVPISGTVAINDIVNGGAVAGQVKADNTDATAKWQVISVTGSTCLLLR